MSAPRKMIGGREFAFGFLTPREALKIEPTIAMVVGRGIGEFADLMGKDPSKLTEDQQAIVFARAATAIVQQVSAEDYIAPDGRRMLGLDSIFKIVFAKVSCDGKDVDLDITFAPTAEGKPRNREKYLVLAEALKVNFSDFFSVAPSASGSESQKGP